jgi:hypothetical protein
MGYSHDSGGNSTRRVAALAATHGRFDLEARQLFAAWTGRHLQGSS